MHSTEQCERARFVLLTKVGEVGMAVDSRLRLDGAKQQHCYIGVHEEH